MFVDGDDEGDRGDRMKRLCSGFVAFDWLLNIPSLTEQLTAKNEYLVVNT